MIRARLNDTAILGLTDVNLRRLQDGQGVPVDLAELGPPGTPPPTRVFIFHATRQALLDLAEKTGADPKDLLDQLGEG